MKARIAVDARRSLHRTLAADVFTLLPRLLIGTRCDNPPPSANFWRAGVTVPATYYAFPYQAGAITLISDGVRIGATVLVAGVGFLAQIFWMLAGGEPNFSLVSRSVVALDDVIRRPAEALARKLRNVLTTITDTTEADFAWPSHVGSGVYLALPQTGKPLWLQTAEALSADADP